MTETYHEYLYGTNFEIIIVNNPFTYVSTTAKMDATDQHSIKYPSEKNSAAADRLDNEESIRQLCFQKSRQSIIVHTHSFPLVESLPI